MMKITAAIVCLLSGLTACSGGSSTSVVSTVQQTQAQIQAALVVACTDVAGAEALANTFGASVAPQVAVIEGYATGACAAGVPLAAIVTAAVNDPSTVAWVENLATELKALKP